MCRYDRRVNSHTNASNELLTITIIFNRYDSNTLQLLLLINFWLLLLYSIRFHWNRNHFSARANNTHLNVLQMWTWLVRPTAKFVIVCMCIVHSTNACLRTQRLRIMYNASLSDEWCSFHLYTFYERIPTHTNRIMLVFV